MENSKELSEKEEKAKYEQEVKENAEKALSIKKYANSKHWNAIKETLKERYDDYKARILQQCEESAESPNFQRLTYSIQDKIQWSKNGILNAIDLLKLSHPDIELSIDEVNGRNVVVELWEKRIESMDSHLVYQTTSDGNAYSETDKLRFQFGLIATLYEKNPKKKESYGVEFDDLIRYLEPAPDHKEMGDIHNPFAKNVGDTGDIEEELS